MGELRFRPDDRRRDLRGPRMIDVEKLLSVGRRSSARVGIGLSPPLFNATERAVLDRAPNLMLKRFQDPNPLAVSLRENSIDCAVRGTLSSGATLESLKSTFRLRRIMRVAVLSDRNGRNILLAPVGIDEGRTASERMRLAERAIGYFESAGWTVSVGVLSKGRLEDGARGRDVARSLQEGELIALGLRRKGVSADHFAILVEEAIEKADLLLAPDGVAGNLMFRTLHFLGGGAAYGAPIVNMDRVFVDTSRSKVGFSDSILLAAGLFELRKQHGQT